MPRSGYKTITVEKAVFELLQERANQNKRTVPKEIEYLIGIGQEKQKEKES